MKKRTSEFTLKHLRTLDIDKLELVMRKSGETIILMAKKIDKETDAEKKTELKSNLKSEKSRFADIMRIWCETKPQKKDKEDKSKPSTPSKFRELIKYYFTGFGIGAFIAIIILWLRDWFLDSETGDSGSSAEL